MEVLRKVDPHEHPAPAAGVLELRQLPHRPDDQLMCQDVARPPPSPHSDYPTSSHSRGLSSRYAVAHWHAETTGAETSPTYSFSRLAKQRGRLCPYPTWPGLKLQELYRSSPVAMSKLARHLTTTHKEEDEPSFELIVAPVSCTPCVAMHELAYIVDMDMSGQQSICQLMHGNAEVMQLTVVTMSLKA